MKMNRTISMMLSTFLLVVLTGCATTEPTRFLFYSKTKKNDAFTYISKDKVPLRIDIPGHDWEFATPTYNHVILRSTKSPKPLINIFEYEDGAIQKRFYKPGFTEEQALEEHFRSESAYQIAHSPGIRARIIEKNIDGPVIPNLLWSLESENSNAYFLTMSRNNHLISISYQEQELPHQGKDSLLEIFRGLQLLTPEQAADILRIETDGTN